MHHELLHDALQEKKVRTVVIEIEPKASKEEEEYYAADFEEDYGQWSSEEDQEEEPERDTHSPTSSEDGHLNSVSRE
jgi:hypothetical protein